MRREKEKDVGKEEKEELLTYVRGGKRTTYTKARRELVGLAAGVLWACVSPISHGLPAWSPS